MTLPAISEAKLSKYEAGQRACVEELVRTRNGTKSRPDDVAATELHNRLAKQIVSQSPVHLRQVEGTTPWTKSAAGPEPAELISGRACRFHGPVAQRLEPTAHNGLVGGSSFPVSDE